MQRHRTLGAFNETFGRSFGELNCFCCDWKRAIRILFASEPLGGKREKAAESDRKRRPKNFRKSMTFELASFFSPRQFIISDVAATTTSASHHHADSAASHAGTSRLPAIERSFR